MNAPPSDTPVPGPASEPTSGQASAQASTQTAGPAFGAPLRTLPLRAPLTWLRLGWRDFTRCPWIGLFYGTCFTTMGWALLFTFRQAPPYVLALSAGFLLVGPFLCLGMYQASRHLERGEKPDLGDSLLAWEKRMGTLAIFGLVLMVLEMLWARSSLVIFALSFDGMPDFKGSLMALVDPEQRRVHRRLHRGSAASSRP